MALVGSTLYLATAGGALLRWNGGGVQNMQPLRGPDPEIWGIGDTAWIVTGDNDGRVGRFVNGVVTLLGAPEYGQAKHIAGISSTEVYITDNSYIYRSYGSAWGYEYGTSFGNISALWGDTATGNIIFVVDNGDITTRTWGSWADHYHAGPAGATEVWGCSATNAWIAVGNQLWRWDGTTATQDGNYASNVFNGTIRSLTGTSCNDIWATADNGFAHYNGSTWTGSYGIPMGVAVPRAAELAWLLNGTTFNRLVGPSGDGWEMRTPTQNRPITAAWRAASGGLLVAGNGFLLWGDK